MSKKTTELKFPMWECVKRSMSYALRNIKPISKLFAIWFFVLVVIELLAGFPSMCNENSALCEINPNWAIFVSILSYTAAIACAVMLHRYIILEEREISPYRFKLRELKYFFYTLGYILIVSVPLIILATITYMLGINITSPSYSIVLLVIAVILSLYWIIKSTRFSLAVTSSAVDNQKNIGFKKSWAITKGNAFKIVIGHFLIMLPVTVLAFVVFILLSPLTSGNSFWALTLVTFVVYAITLLNLVIKISYTSHVYKFFEYHSK